MSAPDSSLAKILDHIRDDFKELALDGMLSQLALLPDLDNMTRSVLALLLNDIIKTTNPQILQAKTAAYRVVLDTLRPKQRSKQVLDAGDLEKQDRMLAMQRRLNAREAMREDDGEN